MACLPMTPTSRLVYDSGYVAAGTTIDTTALTAGEAPYAEVFTLPTVNTTTSQMVELLQLHIRETAGSGTAKKADLQVLFYVTSAPTTPTAGAAYNASVTNLVASAKVVTADYYRIAEGATPIWEARVKPEVWYQTAAGTSNVTSLFAVVVAAGAVTYAAGDTHAVRIVTAQNEQVVG